MYGSASSSNQIILIRAHLQLSLQDWDIAVLATVQNIVFDVPRMSPSSWVSVQSQDSKTQSEFLVSTLQPVDSLRP